MNSRYCAPPLSPVLQGVNTRMGVCANRDGVGNVAPRYQLQRWWVCEDRARGSNYGFSWKVVARVGMNVWGYVGEFGTIREDVDEYLLIYLEI